MLTVASSNPTVFILQHLPSILGQSDVSEETFRSVRRGDGVYIYMRSVQTVQADPILTDETDVLLHARSLEDWC